MSTEDVQREVHAVLDTVEVPPADPVTLLARAQRSRSRRTRRSWMAVAAFVVLLGVAVTLVVRGSGAAEVVDDPDAHVAGTSQALAALAIERLELDPDVSAAGLPGGMDDSGNGLGAQVTTNTGSDRDAAGGLPFVAEGLMVVVDDEGEKICNDQRGGCVALSTPRGDAWLAWETGRDESVAIDGSAAGSGAVYGVVWRDPVTDDFEMVVYFGADFEGDPRDADLPVAVDDLLGLLTDERFGLTTTQDLVDVELAGWNDLPYGVDLDVDAEGLPEGSGSDTVDDPLAGDVAAMVEAHLDLTPVRVSGWAFSEESAGADVRLPGTPRPWLMLEVQADAEGGNTMPRCGAGMTDECATWDMPAGTVRLGWRSQASAGVPQMVEVSLAESGELQRATLMFFDGPELTGDPRDLELPISVDQLVALLSDPGMSLR
jgi:hypothetical protein